jgi:UDP-glucose 4-epimerase
MSLENLSVLVTGGAGFIGSHLVDALLQCNCRVTVLDNLSSGNRANLAHVDDRITFIKGDIRNRTLLTDLLSGVELVFHQAAMVSVPQTVEQPIESAEVNDMGTLFILEAARQAKVRRVVLASSCAVYGDDPRLPKVETMNPKPQSPYAAQKLMGEHYAWLYHQLYGLETVCLRYFNVFGPRQDPSSTYSGVISIFMTRATAGDAPTIYGSGEQFRDFIFVADVARANLQAATAPAAAGRHFNIGTGHHISVNRLWETICHMTPHSLQPRYAPARVGDIMASAADISLARETLRFEPSVSFEEGLKITFDWYIQATVS